jgi:CRISPR-associated protein Csd2
MATIRNRYDFALLFDVRNGNPNGDPDAGNAPRIDPETGHGFVSDVCLKRKIRNYIWLKTSRDGKPKDGYDIYVKEGAILNEQHARAYKAKGLDPKSKKTGKIDELRAWMCQTFFDIRMFGAVMALDVNCGQVRGPVQIAFATSVDPIASLEQSITRMAVATVEEWRKYQEKQEGVRPLCCSRPRYTPFRGGHGIRGGRSGASLGSFGQYVRGRPIGGARRDGFPKARGLRA